MVAVHPHRADVPGVDEIPECFCLRKTRRRRVHARSAASKGKASVTPPRREHSSCIDGSSTLRLIQHLPQDVAGDGSGPHVEEHAVDERALQLRKFLQMRHFF